MKKRLFVITALLFVFASLRSFAQPVITYSPASSPSSPITLTQSVAISPAITPTSNPAVGAFGYSPTGLQLTGAPLQYPWGIGIDPSQNIYVTNYTANPSQTHQKGSGGTINKFNTSGAYVAPYGSGANLQQPTGIVFDKTGNGYILNYSLMDNGNLKGTAYIEQYSPSGADNGATITGLGYPATGLAIDPSNNLYVASGSGSSSSNISEYVIGNSNPYLVIPAPSGSNFSAVGVDGSYNIYALDNKLNQVLEYSSTGVLLKVVLTGLSSPNAFYVDGGGDIFVGNSGNGTVTVYNPNITSGSTTITINGFTDPRGIATDSRGYLYVSDIGNNTVKQFAPTGGYFINGQLPAGLTFNSVTGAIGGTPTSGFPATTYTITGWNASGSGTTSVTLYCPSSLSLYYDPSVYVLTIGSVTTFTTTPMVTTLSGATINYTVSPSLPTGLSIGSHSGIISGMVANSVAAASTPTIYTVTATQNGSTATTNISILCVKDNYWTGNTNTDWNTGSNWSAGTIPTSSQNATIGVHVYPTGTNPNRNDPVVSTNTQAYIVTFGAAVPTPTLTVQSGATLTLNTMLTVNPGSTPSFITGSGGGSISFVPAAILYVNGNLTSTDNLITLQSNSNASASVGTIPSGASITGAVNVQRFLPGIRGWLLLSSPVNGGSVTTGSNTSLVYGLNYLLNSTWVSGTGMTTSGFSKNGNPSLFLYRENFKGTGYGYAASNYRAVTSLPSTTPPTVATLDGTFSVPIGNGYQLYFRGGAGTTSPFTNGSTAQPATLTATGTLNQGSVTYTNWNTPGTPGLLNTTISGSPNIEGFNLVGNPYACTINLATYQTGGISMSGVSNYVYELNPTTGTFGVYTLDGTLAPINYASQYIASGQGFFVQATSTSATLTFNETCKKENQQNTGYYLLLSKGPVATAVPQYMRLHLALDSINSDETIIRFNEQAKTNYVFNEDALYMTGTSKVNLASLSSDNQAMAINTRPLATHGDTIKLTINGANGTYSISINAITGIPQLYDIWLMDAYKKDSVDMRHNSTYSFDVKRSDTATFGANRFRLIIRQNPAYAYHLLDFTASKATGRQVQLVWNTENEANYTNFTVQRSTDGGKTYDVVGGVPSTGAGQYALLDKNPGENNLYRLQQVDINNVVTYSPAIPIGFANQNGSLANSAINVYPNPAHSTIDLTVKEGTVSTSPSYRIRIVSSTGLIVQEVLSAQASWHGNIGHLLPGTYIVKVLNDKTQSFVGESKLIKL